ncbi:alpha/beta fold hydrolase [Microbacterium sp. 1.5R]|uniref:alpha/beta fold hydrolase n=1 Tax=Microbacterium sp. 1.5R TaxID=1916917 RepID=UPI0011A64B12|nr:alpha/beta fold hydrolase [Microbacterium sp. 1.5R]
MSASAPLVLLAGMNCTADLWADADFDAEGAGAIRPTLDRPSLRAQVDALLAELPARFVLVGHSLGGIVGMALALTSPERVAGLCLVATNAKAPTSAQREGWREWMRRLDAGADARSLQHGILEPLLGEHLVAERPDLVERTLRMGADTGKELLRTQLALQLTRVDLLSRLSSLRMPTLVVSGLDDVICPPSFHTEIVAALPDARLVSLDAGHLLPLERPREFADLVRAWRSQQVRPAAVA